MDIMHGKSRKECGEHKVRYLPECASFGNEYTPETLCCLARPLRTRGVACLCKSFALELDDL
jgi:hypothetical protein